MSVEVELAELRVALVNTQRDLAKISAYAERTDEFASGILHALLPILPLLLKQDPQMADVAMRLWGRSRWKLEHQKHGGPAEHAPEYYEPALICFGVCKAGGVPLPGDAGDPANPGASRPPGDDSQS